METTEDCWEGSLFERLKCSEEMGVDAPQKVIWRSLATMQTVLLDRQGRLWLPFKIWIVGLVSRC